MLQKTTPVVKNIIIINVIFFIATSTMMGEMGELLQRNLLSYYPLNSDYFKPWQIVTHMFMHGSITHIFFNMFALYMFGVALEKVWGSKRFLIFYMATGLGAYLMYQGWNAAQIYMATGSISPSIAELNANPQALEPFFSRVLGASGAVFGILAGFGMLFPNTVIQLLFPPIPIKAKYFVLIYGAIELFMTISNNGGNVAHIAHVGGMVFGYFIVKKWNANRGDFY